MGPSGVISTRVILPSCRVSVKKARPDLIYSTSVSKQQEGFVGGQDAGRTLTRGEDITLVLDVAASREMGDFQWP
jgi:hypothetical protein